MKRKINHDFLNIGGGEHLSIKKVAIILKKIIGFKGKIIFNKKYPDGVKERKLDSSIIKKIGWKPKISLINGLKQYCNYYKDEIYPFE